MPVPIKSHKSCQCTRKYSLPNLKRTAVMHTAEAKERRATICMEENPWADKILTNKPISPHREAAAIIYR